MSEPKQTGSGAGDSGPVTFIRWAVPLFLSVAVLILARDLDPKQRNVAAVFALTVGLWITQALPLAITALLSTALLVLLGGLGEGAAFAAYGDPVILLFVGSFLLAKAMETTRLDERLAWWTLRNRAAAANESRLVLTTGVISATFSLFVSNTATAAMLLPIVSRVVAATKGTGTRLAAALMLMLTWGSSVAVGVPVGTPPNLIGIGLIRDATGTRITFLQWMAFGMPITIVMVFAGWFLLRIVDLRGPRPTVEASRMAEQRVADLGPVSASQRNTMMAFSLALVLWIAPDLAAALSQLFTGSTPAAVSWMQNHITATVASLIAATLLFILPAADRPEGRTLTWKEALGIDWGVVLLFGGGIALGHAMFASGLAKVIGEASVRLVGAESLWAITAVCIALSLLLSELASNTAAATTVVPIAIGLAQGAGVSPIPPALGAALGASFGFLLPVSTPPNAIVYSSGHLTSAQMAKRGFLLDLAGFVATWACLRLILPPLGLA